MSLGIKATVFGSALLAGLGVQLAFHVPLEPPAANSPDAPVARAAAPVKRSTPSPVRAPPPAPTDPETEDPPPEVGTVLTERYQDSADLELGLDLASAEGREEEEPPDAHQEDAVMPRLDLTAP